MAEKALEDMLELIKVYNLKKKITNFYSAQSAGRGLRIRTSVRVVQSHFAMSVSDQLFIQTVAVPFVVIV